MKLVALLIMMVASRCAPSRDCEHTFMVIVDCDNYTLVSPELYQQGAVQWCPARI
jgi:hypothetical protein